jgi:hypothetical protein
MWLGLVALAVLASGVVVAVLRRPAGSGVAIDKLDPTERHEILLFSEGANYEATFRPLVDAFLARGRPIVYVTLDGADPILSMRHERLDARCVGKGMFAYARLGHVQARLMLATTPNIGAPGSPMARSKGVETLVHVCHAVSGLGNYHKHSLDFYDAVLSPGDFMLGEVRHLEQLRGLKPKACVTVGLPYLDFMAARAQRKPGRSDPPVVLVAPSWGVKNFLRYTGSGVVHDLARAGFDVILRPHPQSWMSQAEECEALARELAVHPNVVVDRAVDGSASLQRADVLVSARSAVRFDFAFLHEKPVVSVRIPFPADHPYEFAFLGRTWEDDAETHLGPVVDPGEAKAGIVDLVRQALDRRPERIAELRAQSVGHWGTSSERIVDWCVARLEGPGVQDA